MAKETDLERKKRIIGVYNKSAVIYYYMSDYKNSYDFLTKELILNEKYNLDFFIALFIFLSNFIIFVEIFDQYVYRSVEIKNYDFMYKTITFANSNLIAW